MVKTKLFWIYSLILLAWAIVATVTMGLVYRLVLQEAEAAFNQRVVQLYENIEHIVRDNESILEGFSAFLSANEYVNRESTSRYAQQILARYPHVFRLEVVLKVNKNDLLKFIARQKQDWFPEFEVRAFNDSADRLTWQPVKNKPIYNPIIFIEPMSMSAEQLIGADMDSVPFFRDALNQATQLQSPVATKPFKLIKGPRGYVLFNPVPDPPENKISRRKQALALLEVDAEAIQKKIAFLVKNLGFRLYHTSFSSTDPNGLLIHHIPPAQNRLEEELFPKLSADRKLDNEGQPLALSVDKQLGWLDLDLPLVIATGCSLLLSLILLVLFLNTHFRREKQMKKSANRLLHMATHDALTGLPNRTLLEDRFSQASSRTHRRDIKFAVMFIDLNGFKMVNDTHGHEIGDQLLNALGGLLKKCIRDEDTLSRISGDEFVILLEDASLKNAEKVAMKIQAELSRPMMIEGIEMNIGLSLGIAVYPDDGMTMSELLRKADERMYAAKEKSKGLLLEQK
jgi:diguanylate cyclase